MIAGRQAPVMRESVRLGRQLYMGTFRAINALLDLLFNFPILHNPVTEQFANRFFPQDSICAWFAEPGGAFPSFSSSPSGDRRRLKKIPRTPPSGGRN